MGGRGAYGGDRASFQATKVSALIRSMVVLPEEHAAVDGDGGVDEVYVDADRGVDADGVALKAASAGASVDDSDSDGVEVYRDADRDDTNEADRAASARRSASRVSGDATIMALPGLGGDAEAGPGSQLPSSSAPYDPKKRSPEFSGAESSALWELTVLSSHAHPSVRRFAVDLLQGKATSQPAYGGDALTDFTVSAFLERFVGKKPKAAHAAALGRRQADAAAHAASRPRVGTEEFAVMMAAGKGREDDAFFAPVVRPVNPTGDGEAGDGSLHNAAGVDEDEDLDAAFDDVLRREMRNKYGAAVANGGFGNEEDAESDSQDESNDEAAEAAAFREAFGTGDDSGSDDPSDTDGQPSGTWGGGSDDNEDDLEMDFGDEGSDDDGGGATAGASRKKAPMSAFAPAEEYVDAVARATVDARNTLVADAPDQTRRGHERSRGGGRGAKTTPKRRGAPAGRRGGGKKMRRR